MQGALQSFQGHAVVCARYVGYTSVCVWTGAGMVGIERQKKAKEFGSGGII